MSGLEQIRLSPEEADRQRREAVHDQLDSAHWLAEGLADALAPGGRTLDQAWREDVTRRIRLLAAHFGVAVELGL